MKTIISLFRIFENNVDGHQQKSYLWFFFNTKPTDAKRKPVYRQNIKYIKK